mmetsp:Transcript_23876/g.34926  ORF Transcript_23876/g.34926 Transcript_23876/m.34926 type:complete len:509 (-) Transcript_23876:230-1756(-)|eukprot:CAMPEP_0195534480 /NCGR_PEP_ID=MMETSP0794_2-20130614/42459_1 /TAXON_ID=515487 /ORGANISM="Stephanopyxis turris, Strain CCMP 815" /LENGTH=508 /DNA_ID=CAMNT_0040667341 /DNA_START=96 /DNA_END=1622 /DNA_ORIENTATION=+
MLACGAKKEPNNARDLLKWVALFLGELRDGLTMINMQSAFLITSKNYSEKQVGILFVVFGMSQFLFQTPAGYIMDYSDKKIGLLLTAAIGTTLLTLSTAIFAEDEGGNIFLMIFIKFMQGAITALIPPGLNSITQGIVGSVGMTSQVSKNEMMNHLGTAIIVLAGSLTAFFLYPNIGYLFVVSPIACLGVIYFLTSIKPEHIDHNAARGLTAQSETPDIVESKSNMNDSQTNVTAPKTDGVQTQPSFVFGFGQRSVTGSQEAASAGVQADTPLHVLRDPILLLFTLIVFLFHTANGCVLPLVMQTLALGNGSSGILLSGMCIILAQLFMVVSAKVCGDYSALYGRKILFLIGLFSVSVRCLIIVGLLALEGDDSGGFLQVLILSTQILDGVGAGVFGTMYILVTSDISGGTGRFSLTLGITTAAASIGGTISGYLGEMLAEDFGYSAAFTILGIMSLVPACLYLFFMPETLPAYASAGDPSGVKSKPSMVSIAEEQEGGSSTNYKHVV